MKGILTFLTLLAAGGWINAQIVINEIMYNPPESGTDFLEYIEFLNTGNQPVNILKYRVTDAVVMSFPDTLIAPGAYFVICVDSLKLDSIFGAKAFEWSSGGLRNTDEVITLVDSTGAFVDSVHYYSSWNVLTNGNGPSLELCRSSADNTQAVYWRSAVSSSGMEVNGKTVFGTPGTMNTTPCADHTIQVFNFEFNPAVLEIFTGEQVEWINLGGGHNINGNKNVFPGNPASFGNGAPSSGKWSYIYKFNLPGTYQYQCDPHASSGMTGQIIVRNRDINYPFYNIGDINSTNAQGELDSVNKRCTIEGVVYGVNLRPTGLQFTVIDQNSDGIAVFSSNDNLNYSVEEGDLLRIKGMLSQFNGLTQILPDSIKVIGTNQGLFPPELVTELSEVTESRLVQIKSVELVDPSTWTNSPLGFTVKITDGNQIFDLRIDNDVDLHGEMPPMGKFDVTGLGSQFDATIPYLDGYQIMPRYKSDIKLITSTQSGSGAAVTISPNPGQGYFEIRADFPFERLEILNLQGQLLYSEPYNQNLSVPLPNGLYWMRLHGPNPVILRLMIQR